MSRPIAKINSILEHWAALTPPVIDFTVDNVLRALEYNTTYETVMKILMAKDGLEIDAARLYLCPKNHKAYDCGLDEEIDDDDLPECSICGLEIVNDLDHSFIVFNFSEEFIEDAKKKVLARILMKDHLEISSPERV